eukprot:CAMPEP_0170543604 /NCGR_PEP_ID=MMETSP0211-20121228/2663_1 /TAXON_ID=311385 /ORGANISM="Pseudokeronopsis sp., Strain OXSARD2" /LENGTH=364 /DNA_ID=CAMNT_0010847023 /DNA_START=1171 /DNA_END=2265 /DNA_ORIENTATION=+
MVSVFKIVGLVQKTIKKLDTGSERSEQDVYIWELADNNITSVMQIDVDPDREKQYLKVWKSEILVDGMNNFLFLPEFSSKKSMVFSMIGIDNGVNSSYQQIRATFQILCDKVGGNQKYEDEGPQDNNGLLYSDFLVYENTLFVSHGRFVTAIGIIQPQPEEPQPLPDAGGPPRDPEHHLLPGRHQGADLHGQRNLRPEPPDADLDPDGKWDRHGGAEAGPSSEPQEPEESGERLLQEKNFDVHYEMINLDHSDQTQKIPGKIITIFRNCNSEILPPYFLVENEGVRTIFSINFYTSKLEEYHIDELTKESRVIFLNPFENDESQYALLVECKENVVQGKKIIEHDQNKSFICLKTESKVCLSSS